MGQSLQFAPLPIMEKWLLKIEEAWVQRQVLHVQPMPDGSMISIVRHANVNAFMAGRHFMDDVRNIVSHIRAARAAPSDARAFEAAQAELADARELVGLLEAERIHGRSRVTDYLRVAGDL